MLKGEDDFTLVIMAPATDAATYPAAFHIGFMVNAVEAVDALYKKLQTGGVALGNEPKKIRDSYGFYFQFDTLMIEVGHYFAE